MSKDPKSHRTRGPRAKSLLQNAGQFELQNLHQRGRLAVIAERCGVSRMTVSRWLRGITAPEYANTLVLQEEFGIPLKLWRLAPPRTELERIALFGRTLKPGSETWGATLARGYFPIGDLISAAG